MSQSPEHTAATAAHLNIDDADDIFALLQSAVDAAGDGDEYRILAGGGGGQLLGDYDGNDEDDDDDDEYEGKSTVPLGRS